VNPLAAAQLLPPAKTTKQTNGSSSGQRLLT
jgi:hypothetical protein